LATSGMIFFLSVQVSPRTARNPSARHQNPIFEQK
jgi:hypothetical protein